MKVCLAEEQDKAGTPVKFAPVQLLQQRNAEIHNMIARRAYELFDVMRVQITSNRRLDASGIRAHISVLPRSGGSAEDIILHIDLPGSLTPDQLTVSVEPRRLLVSGEKEISSLYGDASDASGGAMAADLPSA